MAGGGGADSMLRFQLERGGDVMKRRQGARLGSMGRKCDTAQRSGDVGQSRGGTEEGKGRRQRQLD
jgi:hypothetical protein